MIDREKNSITHLKKTSRNVFQNSREQNKNECVNTNVVQKLWAYG